MNATEIKKYFELSEGIDPEELNQALSFLNAVIEQFYPTTQETRGISVPWKRAIDKVCFILLNYRYGLAQMAMVNRK